MSERSPLRISGALAFVLGFGLAPLWLAIAYVAINGVGAPSFYWNAAGWYIVFALPVCGVTILIAAATLAAYSFTDGDGVRRRNVAAGVLFGLCLVASLIAQAWWSNRDSHARDLQMEERDALAIVRQSEQVQRLIGNPFTAIHIATLQGANGTPRSYLFQVTGSEIRYAVVNVSQKSPERTLELACVRRQRPGGGNRLPGYC